MTRKSISKPKQDDPAQFKRFVETAKEIGADADAKTFDKAFGKVTAHPSGKPAKRPSA